ncbi:hypothetical protein KR018_010712 [Drosophila ironensis]|nr:hypothetical protein KR018_010712 [Drosophila ironensis]
MLGQDNGAVRGHRRPLIIVTPAIVLLLSIGSGGGHQLLPPGTHKLCGAALSDAMDAVCARSYAQLAHKRQDATDMSDTEAGYSLGPILSSLFGAEILIKSPRLRRPRPGGISEECCVKSCSLAELADFCLWLPH